MIGVFDESLLSVLNGRGRRTDSRQRRLFLLYCMSPDSILPILQAIVLGSFHDLDCAVKASQQDVIVLPSSCASQEQIHPSSKSRSKPSVFGCRKDHCRIVAKRIVFQGVTGHRTYCLLRHTTHTSAEHGNHTDRCKRYQGIYSSSKNTSLLSMPCFHTSILPMSKIVPSHHLRSHTYQVPILNSPHSHSSAAAPHPHLPPPTAPPAAAAPARQQSYPPDPTPP